MEIEFDPAKDRLNRELHQMSLGVAGPIFDNFRIDDEDEQFDYGETRYVTLGRVGKKIVVCVWTPRGEKARIISLRKAEKDEKEIYNLYRP